jgi:cytochrome c-type biogenesis protein CcmI
VTAFLIGLAVVAAAAAFVVAPLIAPRRGARVRSAWRARDAGSETETVRAIDALREIEFDRATGKLSDDDYAALRAAYVPSALAELRAADGPSEDERATPPRPVICARCACATVGAEALYCAACGAYLPGSCAGCGTPVSEQGARYCSACGLRLAA